MTHKLEKAKGSKTEGVRRTGKTGSEKPLRWGGVGWGEKRAEKRPS